MAKQTENINPLDLLKISERLFCQAFVESYGNAVESYQKAFPKAKYNSARVQAPRLLAKTAILDGIRFLLAQLWRQKEEDFKKTEIYLLTHAVANTDIDEIVDLKNGKLTIKDFENIPRKALKSIRSIKHTKRMNKFGEYDETIEFTLFDKLKAIELLCKMQKMIDAKTDFEGEIIVIPSEKPKRLIEMEEEERKIEKEQEKEIEEIIENEDEEIIVDCKMMKKVST